MEQDRNAQKAEASKACHLVCVAGSFMATRGNMLCRQSRKVELLFTLLALLFGCGDAAQRARFHQGPFWG
jgi:hypothetical protein